MTKNGAPFIIKWNDEDSGDTKSPSSTTRPSQPSCRRTLRSPTAAKTQKAPRNAPTTSVSASLISDGSTWVSTSPGNQHSEFVLQLHLVERREPRRRVTRAATFSRSRLGRCEHDPQWLAGGRGDAKRMAVHEKGRAPRALIRPGLGRDTPVGAGSSSGDAGRTKHDARAPAYPKWGERSFHPPFHPTSAKRAGTLGQH